MTTFDILKTRPPEHPHVLVITIDRPPLNAMTLDAHRQLLAALRSVEDDEEIRCVAVPVFDFAGRVAGAVGISGAVWRLSLQSLQAKAEQVRESARSISAQLGYSEAKAPRVA